jgi:hypothetical protein
MNELGFLLMVPIAIDKKTFPPPLAFIANRFAVFFNYVPLTVTDGTNHFCLPVISTYGAIKRVALMALAYTPVLWGRQA